MGATLFKRAMESGSIGAVIIFIMMGAVIGFVVLYLQRPAIKDSTDAIVGDIKSLFERPGTVAPVTTKPVSTNTGPISPYYFAGFEGPQAPLAPTVGPVPVPVPSVSPVPVPVSIAGTAQVPSVATVPSAGPVPALVPSVGPVPALVPSVGPVPALVPSPSPVPDTTALAAVNPVGSEDLKGQNFLQAAYHSNINIVGIAQTNRNPTYDIRSEVPNPQSKVGPFLNTTIDHDPFKESRALEGLGA